MRYYLYVEAFGRKKAVEVNKEEFECYLNFLEDDLVLSGSAYMGNYYYFARKKKLDDDFVKVGFIDCTEGYDEDNIYKVD